MKTARIEMAPCLRPLEGVDMSIVGSDENVTFIRITAQHGASFPEHSHRARKVTLGATWTIPSNEINSFVTTVDEPTILYEAWSPPREDYLALVEK